ncbi:MAG: family transposase [Herbaspirillum sp.]|jgi:hypothetical protein|nr:family transposase [Herbaspirillum sp.]
MAYIKERGAYWRAEVRRKGYKPTYRTFIRPMPSKACICACERSSEIVATSPSDDAATKLLFLALCNIEKDWKMPQRTWKQAANQFATMFGERFTNAIN